MKTEILPVRCQEVSVTYEITKAVKIVTAGLRDSSSFYAEHTRVNVIILKDQTSISRSCILMSIADQEYVNTYNVSRVHDM